MPEMGVRLMSTASRQSRLLIIIALPVILVLLAVVYFVALRTPDSNFTAVINQIDSAQSSIKKIDAELSATTFIGAIDGTTLDNLKTASENLHKNIDFSNSIITKNKSIDTVYEQQHNAITTYSNQVDNLVAAISSYTSIASAYRSTMSNLQPTMTATLFDKATEDCYATVNNVVEVPSSDFKNDFLAPYATAITDYLDALKRYTTTTNKQSSASAVTQAYTKITALGNQTIDYGITPLKSEVFDTLRTAVASQKSAWLR